MLFNKNGNGTLEVQEIATWTANHDYLHISKALQLAELKFVQILGKEIYNVASEHYKSGDYKVEAQTNEALIKKDNLVELIQTILVNFAYSMNMHKDTVLWDNSGIKVNWNDEFRPAQDATLDKLKTSLVDDAYQFLNALIYFLDENKADFPKFQTSLEAKDLKNLFVNESGEFNYYHDINYNTAYFYELLPIVRRVQKNEIKNALGAYYDKTLFYQHNTPELEAVTETCEIVDYLPANPTTGDLCFVEQLREYWKFDGVEWKFYAFKADELLELVKPAIVYKTMASRKLADMNLVQGRPDQVDLLRASINSFNLLADNHLNKISKYISDLNLLTVVTELVDVTPHIIKTRNSFVI